MIKASIELTQSVPVVIALQKYQEKITNELKKILKYEESQNLANSIQYALDTASMQATQHKYWTGTLYDSIKVFKDKTTETNDSITMIVGADPRVTAQTFRGKRAVLNYAMPVEVGHKTEASYRLSGKRGRRKAADKDVKAYVPGYHYTEKGYLIWKDETGPRVIRRLKQSA